jgi:hypothetical protein
MDQINPGPVVVQRDDTAAPLPPLAKFAGHNELHLCQATLLNLLDAWVARMMPDAGVVVSGVAIRNEGLVVKLQGKPKT